MGLEKDLKNKMINEKTAKAFAAHIEKRKWKEEELEIIRKYHKKYSDREISEKFFKGKRSRAQVERTRCKLGLKRAMQKHQLWSKEEVEILKNNYKKYNQRELKERFFPNKTIEQVRSAKMSRRLYRDPVWTPEEVELLLKYGSVMKRQELQRLHLPNKTVDQISWTKKYYGIKGYQVHRKRR